MTRKQIYEIIEKDDGSNVRSHLYDVFMFFTIILSVPYQYTPLSLVWLSLPCLLVSSPPAIWRNCVS